MWLATDKPIVGLTSTYGGTTTIDSSLTISDNLAVGGTSTLTGATTLTGASTVTGSLTLDGGYNLSGVTATTSNGNGTFTYSYICGKSSILVNNTAGAVTLTLPATSTLPTTCIPTAGDRTSIAISNVGTSTVTIATGTGITLSKATSTATILPSTMAVIEFVRKANTDISSLFTNSY